MSRLDWQARILVLTPCPPLTSTNFAFAKHKKNNDRKSKIQPSILIEIGYFYRA